MLMTRRFWLLIHRYAGLYMAFFLIVAGLTGSVLAFFHELDVYLNPELHQVAILDRAMLDEFELREKALALAPQAQIQFVDLARKPGQVYEAGLIPAINPATGKAFTLDYQTIRLNPYTGELLGYDRDEGLWPLTRRNVLKFIYALHYSLALGEVGAYLFGSAALIWTVDCFVGFYLTLPARTQPGRSAKPRLGRGFVSRWAVAWKIKWPTSTLRLNFDLHRAGGLWTWLMLLVFAWSSVGLNLQALVYQPVMSALFDMPDMATLPTADLPNPKPAPALDWRDARLIGRQLMTEQARAAGFQVQEEQALGYQPAKGLFFYTVKSDRDLSGARGSTTLWFDGDTGQSAGLLLPSGQQIGYTVSMWLFSLHMAAIWGLPFKIFVCLMGLVVAMLSLTGVYIYLKKRRASRLKRL